MKTAQDGGKVVSLTHRPPLTPRNTPGTHLCWRLSRPQGHGATGGIMSMKNSNDTIGNRTRDLPVCSSLCHRAPHSIKIPFNNFSNLSHEYPMKLSFHSQFLKPLTRRELTKFVLVQYYMLNTQLFLQPHEKQPVANVMIRGVILSHLLHRWIASVIFSWACGISRLWRLSVSILSVRSHTW